ncbi:phage baseplate assembly protein V [Chelatococcus sp. XZ-Ab1]|uniref:phage baseplate assembly protein V n=1 Tax=Chelatococcus sp. XZ-Ab1 TaxID=3034027 RepID=UPI0023E35246|nr:phage baseplate assembly protein V [Chelatococcus sp. XZ-Ab1]
MTLSDLLAELLRRIAEVERRQDGLVKRGRVAEVDPAAGKVRLRLNEESAAEPFLSPWVPYAQMAGALKVHSPPSVGQQMTVISETGDFQQGLAVPMTWSDRNPAPSDKGNEHVGTFGQFRFELREGELIVKVPRILIECDGSTFELTGAGLKMQAPDYQFDN